MVETNVLKNAGNREPRNIPFFVYSVLILYGMPLRSHTQHPCIQVGSHGMLRWLPEVLLIRMLCIPFTVG